MGPPLLSKKLRVESQRGSGKATIGWELPNRRKRIRAQLPTVIFYGLVSVVNSKKVRN